MRDGGDDNSTFVVDPLIVNPLVADTVVPVAVSVVEVDDKDVGTDSIDVSLKDDSEDVAVDVAAVVAEDDDDDRREGSDGVRDVSDDVATDDWARVDDVLPAADDGNDVLILLY
jgi:hypothetical protein